MLSFRKDLDIFNTSVYSLKQALNCLTELTGGFNLPIITLEADVSFEVV